MRGVKRQEMIAERRGLMIFEERVGNRRGAQCVRDCRGVELEKMSREIWDNLLTKKGFMQVPRALRLKRSELGLTSKEYVVLLDYVDYYLYCRSLNPYRHLSEVNGVSERSIRSTLSKLEKKGFLKREVHIAGNGRTKGVVFSLAPLIEKLKVAMQKTSPSVPEDFFPPNTREDLNTRQESKKKTFTGEASVNDLNEEMDGEIRDESSKKVSGWGVESGEPSELNRGDACGGGKGEQIQIALEIRRPDGSTGPHGGKEYGKDGSDTAGDREKKWKDPYCAVRWYNEIFSEIYEEAAGQPVLTGGREYKSVETYFRRLKELNPEMSPEEIYGRATEGALFILASQLEGGVFGWMHKPPDICMLASQAQSVDYHLRKIYTERAVEEIDSREEGVESAGGSMRLSFREKIKEGENASKQIKRVYEELRGIERASGAGALKGAHGHKAQEQKAPQGSSHVPRKRGTG